MVENNGLKFLPPYQVLEFLLFYGIPYKDTKPIALELLAKFGSLKGVFTADLEELTSVNNMTKNVALLLRSFAEVYESVFKSSEEKIILGPNNILSYLRKLFEGDLTERLIAIRIMKDGTLVGCDTLAYGEPDKVTIPTKELMQIVLRNKASQVILAHNHPSRLIIPSQEDQHSNDMLGTLLSSVGVRLIDHVIVSGEFAYSCFLRCRMSTSDTSVYPMYKHRASENDGYPFNTRGE